MCYAQIQEALPSPYSYNKKYLQMQTINDIFSTLKKAVSQPENDEDNPTPNQKGLVQLEGSSKSLQKIKACKKNSLYSQQQDKKGSMLFTGQSHVEKVLKKKQKSEELKDNNIIASHNLSPPIMQFPQSISSQQSPKSPLKSHHQNSLNISNNSSSQSKQSKPIFKLSELLSSNRNKDQQWQSSSCFSSIQSYQNKGGENAAGVNDSLVLLHSQKSLQSRMLNLSGFGSSPLLPLQGNSPKPEVEEQTHLNKFMLKFHEADLKHQITRNNTHGAQQPASYQQEPKESTQQSNRVSEGVAADSQEESKEEAKLCIEGYVLREKQLHHMRFKEDHKFVEVNEEEEKRYQGSDSREEAPNMTQMNLYVADENQIKQRKQNLEFQDPKSNTAVLSTQKTRYIFLNQQGKVIEAESQQVENFSKNDQNCSLSKASQSDLNSQTHPIQEKKDIIQGQSTSNENEEKQRKHHYSTLVASKSSTPDQEDNFSSSNSVNSQDSNRAIQGAASQKPSNSRKNREKRKSLLISKHASKQRGIELAINQQSDKQVPALLQKVKRFSTSLLDEVDPLMAQQTPKKVATDDSRQQQPLGAAENSNTRDLQYLRRTNKNDKFSSNQACKSYNHYDNEDLLKKSGRNESQLLKEQTICQTQSISPQNVKQSHLKQLRYTVSPDQKAAKLQDSQTNYNQSGGCDIAKDGGGGPGSGKVQKMHNKFGKTEDSSLHTQSDFTINRQIQVSSQDLSNYYPGFSCSEQSSILPSSSQTHSSSQYPHNKTHSSISNPLQQNSNSYQRTKKSSNLCQNQQHQKQVTVQPQQQVQTQKSNNQSATPTHSSMLGQKSNSQTFSQQNQQSNQQLTMPQNTQEAILELRRQCEELLKNESKTQMDMLQKNFSVKSPSGAPTGGANNYQGGTILLNKEPKARSFHTSHQNGAPFQNPHSNKCASAGSTDMLNKKLGMQSKSENQPQKQPGGFPPFEFKISTNSNCVCGNQSGSNSTFNVSITNNIHNFSQNGGCVGGGGSIPYSGTNGNVRNRKKDSNNPTLRFCQSTNNVRQKLHQMSQKSFFGLPSRRKNLTDNIKKPCLCQNGEEVGEFFGTDLTQQQQSTNRNNKSSQEENRSQFVERMRKTLKQQPKQSQNQSQLSAKNHKSLRRKTSLKTPKNQPYKRQKNCTCGAYQQSVEEKEASKSEGSLTSSLSSSIDVRKSKFTTSDYSQMQQQQAADKQIISGIQSAKNCKEDSPVSLEQAQNLKVENNKNMGPLTMNSGRNYSDQNTTSQNYKGGQKRLQLSQLTHIEGSQTERESFGPLFKKQIPKDVRTTSQQSVKDSIVTPDFEKSGNLVNKSGFSVRSSNNNNFDFNKNLLAQSCISFGNDQFEQFIEQQSESAKNQVGDHGAPQNDTSKDILDPDNQHQLNKQKCANFEKEDQIACGILLNSKNELEKISENQLDENSKNSRQADDSVKVLSEMINSVPSSSEAYQQQQLQQQVSLSTKQAQLLQVQINEEQASSQDDDEIVKKKRQQSAGLLAIHSSFLPKNNSLSQRSPATVEGGQDSDQSPKSSSPQSANSAMVVFQSNLVQSAQAKLVGQQATIQSNPNNSSSHQQSLISNETLETTQQKNQQTVKLPYSFYLTADGQSQHDKSFSSNNTNTTESNQNLQQSHSSQTSLIQRGKTTVVAASPHQSYQSATNGDQSSLMSSSDVQQTHQSSQSKQQLVEVLTQMGKEAGKKEFAKIAFQVIQSLESSESSSSASAKISQNQSVVSSGGSIHSRKQSRKTSKLLKNVMKTIEEEEKEVDKSAILAPEQVEESQEEQDSDSDSDLLEQRNQTSQTKEYEKVPENEKKKEKCDETEKVDQEKQLN